MFPDGIETEELGEVIENQVGPRLLHGVDDGLITIGNFGEGPHDIRGPMRGRPLGQKVSHSEIGQGRYAVTRFAIRFDILDDCLEHGRLAGFDIDPSPGPRSQHGMLGPQVRYQPAGITNQDHGGQQNHCGHDCPAFAVTGQNPMGHHDAQGNQRPVENREMDVVLGFIEPDK